MAKLYIPSQSPLVRAKRGFGAPNKVPTEPVKIKDRWLSRGLTHCFVPFPSIKKELEDGEVNKFGTKGYFATGGGVGTDFLVD